MAPTLILPGLNGSPPEHWQRHWARERPDAYVVEQRDWACPALAQWQARLDEALHATGGAFIVAHSLGCLLAASYAGRAQSHLIRGALLVAPCSLEATTELHPCMIDFGEEPLERLPFPSVVVGSLNDPYMDVEQLERHVTAWGSGLAMIGFAGHINLASGFGRWPEGYELFETLRRHETASAGTLSVLAERGTLHSSVPRP